MNGIFIIAHAPLASALRASVLHVFPDAAAQIMALDVLPHAAPEETLVSAKNMLAQLTALPNITAVLVLTDIFGATPCNIALKLVDGLHAKLIAGANLPMLMRAMTYRDESLDVLVSKAVAGGIQGVMSVAITALQNQTLKPYDQNNRDHQQ